jgi:eukaryotic-like serine/threonine-protein kinase
VFSNRVITNAIVLAGSLLASGLFAGEASAQYESVGKPLQLVPQAYSSPSSATPRARVAAKKAARADMRAETKSETRAVARNEPKTEPTQHISFRRKHPARTEVAEQRRGRRVSVASTETPAARTATPVRPASAPPTSPLPPQAAPVQPSTGELVVDGQAVQVRSPDEANELDLAANMASPPPPKAPAAPQTSAAAAPAAKAPLYDLAPSNPPAPPAASETPSTDAVVSAFVGTAAAAPISPPAPAIAATVPAGNTAMLAEPDFVKASDPQPRSPIGSASWMMQVMAALGGAIAAGTAAWFLIGRASPRIKLSEWEEADGEA